MTDAREYLLKLGRREVEAAAQDQAREQDQAHTETNDEPMLDHQGGRSGSHVIAPCPHDRTCPLAFHQQLTTSARRSVRANANDVRCTFVQRLQRPAFVRRTKHAGRGEEDVGYAYVVVRRGVRDRDVSSGMVREGRVGAVGRWAEVAARAKQDTAEAEQGRRTRWTIDEDGVEAGIVVEGDSEAVRVEASEESIVPVDGLQEEVRNDEEARLTGQALEDALRNEAYSWPRINFPPLKRSGHVLIDACMPEGMLSCRLTDTIP